MDGVDQGEGLEFEKWVNGEEQRCPCDLAIVARPDIYQIHPGEDDREGAQG